MKTVCVFACAALGVLVLTVPTAAAVCIAPEGPPGTTELVPPSCSYVSIDPFVISGSFPPGTDIQIDVEIVSMNLVSSAPGGDLGGEIEDWTADIELSMTGTGGLAGFNRFIIFPITVQTFSAPRNPGDAVQAFVTEIDILTGEILGDPDFNFLRIQAGKAFGLPSPGNMTLTDLGGGNWNLESFFDVFYVIDFIGEPGGAIGGIAGTNQGNAGIELGEPAQVQVPTGTTLGLILMGLALLVVLPVVARLRS